jgi:hypothetical protein
LSYGLTPWRRRAPHSVALPRPRTFLIWSERWDAHDERLRAIEAILRDQCVPVRRGGEYDNWDLEVRGGFLACVRTRLGVEEYPRGRQYLRFRAWPCLYRAAYAAALPGVFATGAAFQQASSAALALSAIATLILLRALGDYAAAIGSLRTAVERYGERLAAAAPDDGAPAADPPPALHGRLAASEDPHAHLTTMPAEPRFAGDHRLAPMARIPRPDMLDPPARHGRTEPPQHAGRPPGAGVLDDAVDGTERPTAAVGDWP